MPKAIKKTRDIAMNTKEKPVEAAKPVKTEPIELANPLYQSVTKLNYQPIAPVHFEELSNIWEKNRRMPTVASRTAWSLARNLNPLNVNNWWYRRKIIAKKFKIKIPGDSYELDVGIPPLVDIKLEELSMPTHAPEAAGSDSTFPNSGSGDELVDLSSSTCVDLIAWKTNSPGDERTPIKGAYIHDSKVSEEVTVASDDTPAPAFCDSSPIPNSPNIWPSSSLPPTSRIASPELDRDLSKESTTSRSDYILVWDHTVSTSIGGRERLDLVAELDGPFEVLSESSFILTPFQLCQWSEAFLSFYTFPTWCFAGLRAAYDGSIVCDCLCSTILKSFSAEASDGRLNSLVLTDELGDKLLTA